ncbi:transglutaminase [Pseudooceanicola lipolyticus]|uniref:Transglutaminase n=1 Tax=Pseudooceanicola lipolyticus TaxID=2029104 RepID=A0A2M8IZU0_9RHOB|nr:transglutaminase family protein [Pseudooceanicola lipolyticus]PJE36053.1 transglutaminase [Pseudooceanicola lipolyticus]
MLLTISHTTTYRYETPVHYALQQLRMTPCDNVQQRVLDWKVDVAGGGLEVSYKDHHGNHVDLVNLDRDATEVTITAAGRVETTDTAGILGNATCPLPLWYFRQQTELTEPGDGIRALADELGKTQEKLDALHALSEQIRSKVEYGTGETYAATAAEQALSGGRGVCQDHAQIFVSAARAAGIPARYVSGYMMMNDRIDQEASHAWAEAWLDLLGWVGFDISNGYSPDERYVRIAIGRDYRDAAPVSGLRQGTGDESMIVSLQIQQ